MSKREILEFLQQNPDDWFSVKDLANKFQVAKQSASCNCLKLRKDKIVETKVVTKGKSISTYYRCKQ